MTRVLAPLLVLAAAAPAQAQSTSEAFYRAYYLQHERHDLDGALALYRRVSTDAGAPKGMRQEAARFSAEALEDLAASDLARLMPAETLLYAELKKPGARLESLLSQLGLMQDGQGERLGVSPSLVRGLLGLRGAAVALTQVDPSGRSEPSGVVVLHPGDLDVVRGLIETALPAGGQPVEPIAGRETYSLEGQAYATLGARLVVLSNERHLIEGVLARADGEGGPSLADSQTMRDLAELRGEDLAFFCINAEPMMPMVVEMIEREAHGDPQLAMALDMTDLGSLEGIAGRIGVEDDGLSIDVALQMADDHRSLPFNLLRMPHLNEGSFDLVPAGAAFFLATALNDPAHFGEGPRSGSGERIVTLMDFGREIFGNIIDVAFYALPPDGGAAMIPPVGMALRVNDVDRSRALWQTCLGLATQAASQGRVQPESVDVGGYDAERYAIQGVPVYFAAQGGQVLVTPSAELLEASFAALEEGDTVRNDPAFARALEDTSEGHTFAVMAHPGRMANMARPFLQGQQGEQVAMAAQLLAHSTLAFSLEHSQSRLALSGRLFGVPDVSGVAAQVLHANRARRGHEAKSKHTARTAVAAVDDGPCATETRKSFDDLVAQPGRTDDARAVARELVELLYDDANGLNDFAWALLTEKRYANAFDGIAFEASVRSNELSQHGNWAYLDTLAWAHFERGEVHAAVETGERALDLASKAGKAQEARRSLDRFRSALDAVGTN